jgi:hypothetical protein
MGMVLNWKTIFFFRLESLSTIQFVPGSGLSENMEKNMIITGMTVAVQVTMNIFVRQGMVG